MPTQMLSHPPASDIARLLKENAVRYNGVILPHEEVHFEKAINCLGKREKRDGEYSFVQFPNNRQWKTFMQLSTHVRSLDVSKAYGSIFRAILDMGCVHQSDPFPNLQSLKWTAKTYGDLIDISALMVPTLKQFSLELHDLPWQFFRYISECVTARVPRLRCLQISLPDNHMIATPEAVQIMTELLTAYSSTLIQIQIPTAFALPSVIEVISKMSNLCDMAFGFDSVLISNLDLQSYPLSNKIGGLPHPYAFSYRGSPRTLVPVIVDYFDLSALSVFTWDAKYELDELIILIEIMVPACPRLTTLKIKPGPHNYCALPVIPGSIVQNLLEFKNLTSISIRGAQVDMNRIDLFAFLGNRHTWTKVELYTLSSLTLHDLYLYASLCSNLEYLGMLVEVPSENDLLAVLNNPLSATFSQLRTLDLAYSDIPPEFCFTIGCYLHKISRTPIYVVSEKPDVGLNINKVIYFRCKGEVREGKRMSDEERRYISIVEKEMESVAKIDFDSRYDE